MKTETTQEERKEKEPNTVTINEEPLDNNKETSQPIRVSTSQTAKLLNKGKENKSIPLTYEEAINGPDKEKWLEAIKEEN